MFKKFITACLLSVMFLTPTSEAASISRIKVWLSGDKLKASEMNAEFDNVVSGVNDKDTRLTPIESRFSSSVLGVPYGGLGLSSIASGKLIYASGTNVYAPLTLGATLGISSGTLSVQQTSLSLGSISGTVGITQGGSGQTTAAASRAAFGAAASGANSDITSLSALATPLSQAQGGTANSSYTDGQLLIGNTSTTGLTKATLTAGTGISITNGNGSITVTSTSVNYPTGYIRAAAPIYASATTFTMANFSVRSADDTANISKLTSTTVDTSTTGLNGLARSTSNLTGTLAYTNASATVTGTTTAFSTDLKTGDTLYDQTNGVVIGTVLTVGSNTSVTLASNFSGTSRTGVSFRRGSKAASSTWYLYAISDGTTPGLILSNRNVAAGDTLVDLPAGYSTVTAKELSFATVLDSSAALYNFRVGSGWPNKPEVTFVLSDTNSPYMVLNGGTSATFAAVSTSALIPGGCRLGMLNFYSSVSGTVANSLTFIRETGTAGNGRQVGSYGFNGTYYVFNTNDIPNIPLNSSQQFDYKVSTSSGSAFSAYVTGYVITDIN